VSKTLLWPNNEPPAIPKVPHSLIGFIALGNIPEEKRGIPGSFISLITK
jgi:hypothetical protein